MTELIRGEYRLHRDPSRSNFLGPNKALKRWSRHKGINEVYFFSDGVVGSQMKPKCGYRVP